MIEKATVFLLSLGLGKLAVLFIIGSLYDVWDLNCPVCRRKISFKEYLRLFLPDCLLLKPCCRSRFASWFFIENTAAFLCFYFYLYCGLTPYFFLYAGFSVIMLMITVTDAAAFIVDDKFVVAGILLALPFKLYLGELSAAILGAISGFSVSFFFFMALRIYTYFKKLPDGYGDGDVTIAALLGFVLGWYPFLVVFALGIFLQGIFVILNYIYAFFAPCNREKGHAVYLPLVPFLSLAVVIYSYVW